MSNSDFWSSNDFLLQYKCLLASCGMCSHCHFAILQDDEIINHAKTTWYPSWTKKMEEPVTQAWKGLKDALSKVKAVRHRYGFQEPIDTERQGQEVLEVATVSISEALIVRELLSAAPATGVAQQLQRMSRNGVRPIHPKLLLATWLYM